VEKVMRAVIAAVFMLIAAALTSATSAFAADLKVMVWNIKDLTANNLDKRLGAIASSISNVGPDVAFILENLSGPDNVAKNIITLMGKQYSTGGAGWTYVWSCVGNENKRVEYVLAIIRNKGDRAVDVKDYGILDRVNAYANELKFQSVTDNTDAQAKKAKMFGPAAEGRRVPFYLQVGVKPSQLAEAVFKVAIWHGPGPNNDPYEQWQKYKGFLSGKVAVAAGDFNFNSDDRANADKKTGTTSGGNQYDGVYVLDKDHYTVGTVNGAIGKTETASDHQYIVFSVSPLSGEEKKNR
jgi:hypothetical protein